LPNACNWIVHVPAFLGKLFPSFKKTVIMKNLLLALSLCYTFSLPAQNTWDLFPLNQKTWWRAGDTLRLSYNDSTEVLGDDRYHYFGSKYILEVFDDCFSLLWGDTPEWIPFSPPLDFIYSWNSKNDVWKLNGDDLPIFYPKSLPGENWTFPVKNGNGYNKIRIECLSSDTVDIFGQAVFAKHFRLMPMLADVPANNSLSNFEMTLTETFGLTRFIPFHELVEGKTGPVYEIAGLVNGGKKLGLTPDFETFTKNYEPGNLYKWRQQLEYYPAGESTVWWYLDSLTSVTRTADEIQLTSHRQTTKIFHKKVNGVTTTDSSTYLTPEFKRVLKRIDFQPLFDAAYSWYHPAVTEFFGNMAYVTSHFDSTGAVQLSGDYNYVFEPCDLRGIIDANHTASIDNRCGFKGFLDGFLFGWHGEQLVGCRQGAETWGDITPPPTVGIFQPAPVFSLRIYPSLTTGHVVIEDLPETSFNGTLRLEVRGMDGRLGLENSEYQRGQPADISGLPAGVYLLTIRSKNAVATGKVVKM